MRRMARGGQLGSSLVAMGLALTGWTGCQGTVDQEQLIVTGGLGIGPGLPIGQTFTAGCSGPLTGIELGVMLGDAGYIYPDVVIQVSGPSGVVGTSSLPASVFSAGALPPLSHDTVGSGFFALSTQNISVTSGTQYAVEVLGNPSMAGSCDLGAGTCSTGRVGQACAEDWSCDLLFFVDDTGDSDPYPGGYETINGGERPGFDLAFKTFVQSCTP